MDMVDFCRFEFFVTALPADEIPDEHACKDEQAESGAPVHGWVTEEEVFDDLVVPAAHAETDVQDGPLPELGGEVVLLIRIGDKGVI